MKIFNKLKIFAMAFCLALILTFVIGCKKLVEVDSPKISVNGENVFENDETSIGVLTGIYANMSNASPTSFQPSISSFFPLFTGLSSDELKLYNNTSSDYLLYYNNALTDLTGKSFWPAAYKVIYITNSAIEGLNASQKLTPAVKKQLLGEAKFMRAYCYFYLYNLYGEVPLLTTSDYKINSSASRSSKPIIYQQIINDLIEAQGLLSNEYLSTDFKTATTERISPTRWAATAFLARVYLFVGDYQNAVVQSNAVIEKSQLFSLGTLADAFLMNTPETIWSLQPVKTGWNTEDARTFILPASGPSATRPAYLSKNLLESFEPGDARKDVWTKSVTVNGTVYSFAYKYKSATQGSPVTEYAIMLRLSEQFLVRAEAKANLNDLAGALADVNIIRARARAGSTPSVPNPLPNLSSSLSKADLINAIIHERQIELFTENGLRWLDLKRTNTIDAVMTNAAITKGSVWKTTAQLYPIPLADLQADPNLKQNPGY